MWNLIAALALAALAPTDVTVTKLDGTSVSGQLRACSAGEIVLTTADGPQSIPTAKLVAMKFSNAATGDTGKPQLELVDGSVLPLASYTATDSRAVAQLQLPSPADPKSLVLPLDQVRAVRLQAIDAEVLPQWREIRQLDVPSDLIVVFSRGGKSLDHLECVLGKITVAEVEIELDGKMVRVPRRKVAGLVYYRSDERAAEAPSYMLIGPDGLCIAAKMIHWHGDELIADTTTCLKLSWPLSGIASIDLSAGKVFFLGDAEPADVSWQPRVGLPTAASRAAQFGTPRFNQSAVGGPLALAYRDDDPAVSTPEIKPFAKGLAIRSRSTIVYRLPKGYHRFLAVVGIEPATAASGNVILSIFGDDHLLVEQAIDGSDAPLPLDLDVTGVRRLRILVDYGENLDTGDWLNLCNARIVK